MIASFTDDEWRNLTPHDKHTIKELGRFTGSFEPLRKFKGVGDLKIRSVVAKGLAAEGPSFPRNEIGYALSEKGWLAFDRCIGRRAVGNTGLIDGGEAQTDTL